METKEPGVDVLQILRNYSCQHRLLYPPKLLVTRDGEKNTLHDKTKFNQDQNNIKAAMLEEKKSNQKRFTT